MNATRREFLKAIGASTELSLGAGAPAFLGGLGASLRGRALAGESENTGTGSGRVLVAIQLTGGNDGLNTLVPYEDDAYARSRPTLRLRSEQVLKLDGGLGLHPEMAALRKVFDTGRLAILQGVGHAGSSRDHDIALRDWHTARPGDASCQTGWLGRAADLARRPCDPEAPAAFVGPIDQPFALNARRTTVSAIRSLREPALRAPDGADGAADHLARLSEAALSPRAGGGSPLLEHLCRSARAAAERSRRIETLASTYGEQGGAPFPLARTLRTVTGLIRADCGVRIYLVELGGGGIGGFDSHANQGANHGALLQQLSESMAAFLRDLDRDGLLDRVLLLTFSEFGRTLGENGRHGTDHGAAAPIFLAGGAVKGGIVGALPSLTDLDQGGLESHTDFRRVYATALGRWLGYDARAILGEAFEPLDVL